MPGRSGSRRSAGATSGVDLIHAHDARAHTLALLGGKPAVSFAKGCIPGAAWRRIALEIWPCRALYRRVAVCETERCSTRASLPERITVVYDGVPIETPRLKSEGRSGVVALDSDDPAKRQEHRGAGRRDRRMSRCISRRTWHRIYRSAAVFVYITELEGLGSAALLAMAAGAAVLASRVGGLPEIVEDGVTGLLTSNEPRDGCQWYRTIIG